MTARFGLFAVLLVCGCAVLHGQTRASDEEFAALLEELPGRNWLAFEIAYSGHPRAIQVLRELKSAAEQYPRRWGDFKDKYGYPSTVDSRANIQLDAEQLEVALAAAGDEAAFEAIVAGYHEKTAWQKEKVLKKLSKVRRNRAVRFLGEALYDDAWAEFVPVAVRATEALYAITKPEGSERFVGEDPTTENFERRVKFWRSWWEENAESFEGEGLVDADPTVITDEASPPPLSSETTELATPGAPQTRSDGRSLNPWIVLLVATGLAAAAWLALRFRRRRQNGGSA